MRLWTLHPRMLDTKGLTALWREGLGAQKALYYYVQGKPFGYQHHPQLDRFKATGNPVASLVSYLEEVHAESVHRGYNFNKSLILTDVGNSDKIKSIPVTEGQIGYELEWLEFKLEQRSPNDLIRLENVTLHPLFHEVPGDIEPWERVK